MLPVAILAGGLASRMLPLTAMVPKALLDVAGQPFLFRQLRYLQGQGVDRVVLCTGYLGEQIESEVGNGSRFGLRVDYSKDGPLPLGTGGALRQALPLLDQSFFVLYGDSFLPCDYRRVERAYESSGKPAILTVFRNKNQWDKSNVLFRDGVLVEYNKRAPDPEMEHIDYGLSVLSSDLLEEYPLGQTLDLGDVYHDLSCQGRLAGIEVAEKFYEIGSPSGLQEAESYFLKLEKN